ncbi:pectin acetylesterase [Aureococcus anophagefferens]|nr:pectin acetylesterase [Aureococcus anophagefferens]
MDVRTATAVAMTPALVQRLSSWAPDDELLETVDGLPAGLSRDEAAALCRSRGDGRRAFAALSLARGRRRTTSAAAPPCATRRSARSGTRRRRRPRSSPSPSSATRRGGGGRAAFDRAVPDVDAVNADPALVEALADAAFELAVRGGVADGSEVAEGLAAALRPPSGGAPRRGLRARLRVRGGEALDAGERRPAPVLLPGPRPLRRGGGGGGGGGRGPRGARGVADAEDDAPVEDGDDADAPAGDDEAAAPRAAVPVDVPEGAAEEDFDDGEDEEEDDDEEPPRAVEAEEDDDFDEQDADLQAALALSCQSLVADEQRRREAAEEEEAATDAGAVCNDGTPAAYYFAPGSPSSKTFLVYLSGGGQCYDAASCAGRGDGSLYPHHNCSTSDGRSRASCRQGLRRDACNKTGIFSEDPAANRPLHGAHKAYVPYCSSDAHMGDGEKFGLQFRGRRIVDAVLADLAAHKGLGDADLVVFGGGSAGGRGAMVHLDRAAATLSAGAGAAHHASEKAKFADGADSAASQADALFMFLQPSVTTSLKYVDGGAGGFATC